MSTACAPTSVMTPAERSQLFETLSELSLGDFEWLVFSLKPPAGIVPPDVAPQKSRVAALLEWADSFGGCGLSEVQSWLNKLGTMTTSQNPLNARFQEYLDLACTEYKNYWKRYAFIDEIREEWFEFALNTEVQKKSDQEDNTLKKPKMEKQSILKAIREIDSKSLLIHGKSGSGKSTLLAKLFYEAVLKAQQSESDLIPVLIELKSYEAVGESPGIQGLLLRTLQNYDPELGENDLTHIKKQKKLLLFIDGFNELADDKANIKIKEYCKNISTIVTSRSSSDWREIEKKLGIDPLSPQEVTNFFRERIPGSSQSDLEALGSRVKDFGETPLMVWMLYSIFNTSKEIPETRGEAYRRFTTLYVEQAKEGIDLSESQILLRKLAFEMMQSCNSDESSEFRPQISEIEAQNVLGSEATLKLLRNCHLLNSYGQHGKRRIQFCHQSLQEYYAAEEILERLRSKNPNFSDDKHFQYFFLNRLEWTETISLMMSLLNDRDHDLMVRITQLALDTDLLLGAKLAGSVKPDFQHKTIDLLLEPKIKKSIFGFPIRLSLPDWLKILIWQETRSAALKEKWLGLLDNNSSWVRWHAIRGLRYCEPKDVVTAFSKALDDEDEDIRLLAVKGLADVNSDVVLDSLIKATKDNNWSVQVEAVQALIELKTKKAMPVFREMLSNESGIVRHYAVQGLSELGPEVAVPELTSLTSNRRLFPAVSTFLSKIGTEEALLGLLKALENTEPAARKYAIEEIGKFNSELVIPSLINLLYHDKDFSVRAKAVHTLGELGKNEVVFILIEALGHEHYSVYLAAAVALMKFEPEISLSRIEEALFDEEIEVRKNAIAALKEIEIEQRLPLLVKALEDKEPCIRCRAIYELGEIGSKSIESLQPMLKDSSRSVRQVTALTLAKKGVKTGISEILSILEEKEFDDRHAALDSYSQAKSTLKEISLQEIIPDLRQFIEDKQPGTDSLLIKWFLPEIMAELLLISIDGEDSLRKDSKYLLNEIPSQKILKGHLEALAHPDEKVRFSAGNALKARATSEVLSEAAKIRIRQDDGTIFRSLIELFPVEFYKGFVDRDGIFSIRAEYSKDSTVPILSDFSGSKKSVSGSVIQLLAKAAKKDDIDLLLRLIQICSTIIPQQSASILLKLLKSKHSIVSRTAYEQLVSLGPDNFLPELMNVVSKEKNSEIRSMAIRLLGNSKSKEAANAMPILSKLLLSRFGPTALNALNAIQTNCYVYSYSITRLDLKPVNCQFSAYSTQTINIKQVDRLYSQQIDTLNSNQIGNLNNASNGDINIEGDQKGFS